MPAIIRIKRSGQPGAVPQNLATGELAYNFADRALYIGGPGGEIHQLAAEGQIVVVATEQLAPPVHSPPPTQTSVPVPGFTISGIRRRLLPFES